VACLVIAGGIAIHAPATAQAGGTATRLPVPSVLRGTVRGHALRWHAPRWWLPQAVCIHEHEGAWDANTGNGYYGGMQFTLYTWRSVGGASFPHLASPREQLHRAWLVYRRDGNSWREWGTAGACGLR
jgi:resuscitation-promoting factor RpfB